MTARRGFTVFELIVALTISAFALLSARALLETIAASGARIRSVARQEARNANRERLLRALVGRLYAGDSSATFTGDPRQAQFTSWCDVSGGWQERCQVTLGIDTAGLVAVLSTGERFVLRQGFRAGELRYLNSPTGGGEWFKIWSVQLTQPLAIGVIADGDTTIVRIGERG
jgi:prepilin-type N-terminal cleavage/methylation domain-containing protein